MYTALILAGGSSLRMGSDKAFLKGGVERLCSELRKGDCSKIIVLCGNKSRVGLFVEECWPDPNENMSVAEILRWAIARLEGEIQLVPCDAFLADQRLFSVLKYGVPLDASGRRQPLLARLQASDDLGSSLRVEEMLGYLPSQNLGSRGMLAKNVNSPEDFKGI
jgi:molybdopterin-guanine dinucleotide biosynthesis protein A